MKKVTNRMMINFEAHLRAEEKSPATVEKYIRDVRAFSAWLHGRALEKSAVLAYKSAITAAYAPMSVNSMLSSLNRFFSYIDRRDCTVKTLKIQRQLFASREKELTKDEYARLLNAAKMAGNERLNLVMQTICASGIRVSELRFITVEAVNRRQALVRNKGKTRTVFLPKALCRELMVFIKKKKRTSGAVFVTRNGRPLDRSNIWSEMKKLCALAGVARSKVFPHNLRHLFARTFYAVQKDIVRLADVLGHASIDTTRIYTRESGEEHRRMIERLGLAGVRMNT